MDELAQQHPEVHVIHHQRPQGVAEAFREGLAQSKFDSMTLLPGDRAYTIEGIERLIEAVGSAELVVSYRTNQAQTRKRLRVLLSRSYCRMMTTIFGCPLRDVHSAVVFPVPLVRQLELSADGYAFQLEVLVKLMRNRPTVAQVPVTLHCDRHNSSRVFKMKSLIALAQAVFRLYTTLPRRIGTDA